MSKNKHRKQQADCREMSASRRAAGLTYTSRMVNSDWERLREQIPDDSRTLTARLCGDPIPGDPRRPWVPTA